MATNKDAPVKSQNEVILSAALRQIGTTECLVCGTRVAVFLTKTNRPFVNCSFCSARVFYNGRESMRLLKKKMKPVSDPDDCPISVYLKPPSS
jgi:DNA-directed RNA polymerase subunit RPC12/RpoP